MSPRFNRRVLFCALVVAALVLEPARAQTPLGTAFTYQGQLKSGGSPANGNFNMVFKLWNDPTLSAPANQIGPTLTFDGVGGNPPPVGMTNGLFTVQLDFGAAYNGDKRWLEIKVSGTTLLPRQELTAAPYALGLRLPYSGSANVAYPNPVFSITNSGTGHALRGDGPSSGVYGTSSNPSGYGVYGDSSATTGNPSGVYGVSASTAGNGVFGNANASTGTTYGVIGSSLSDSGTGVYGSASASSGITTGVKGVSNSGNGFGIYGDAQAPYGQTTGVYGQSQSELGAGVVGNATTSTGAGIGVAGYTHCAYGTGVFGSSDATSGITFGVRGIAYSPFGAGVRGDAAVGVGVWGETHDTAGAGVSGDATAISGNAKGVSGTSASPNGYGVFGDTLTNYGQATGVYGQSISPAGAGVVGNATAATGITFGVTGMTNSVNGYGVFSWGNFGGTGAKYFRIDHPFDPANKYLSHYSAEGPEPLLLYNGNVTTGDDGYAWVALPRYFEAINKDFRYTLTVLNDGERHGFVQAYVSRKITDNRFQIRTSEPNVEVSWMVQGVRNDAWMQQRARPVEEDKPQSERGLYQHPELYGKPKEMGVFYRPERDHPSPPAVQKEASR